LYACVGVSVCVSGLYLSKEMTVAGRGAKCCDHRVCMSVCLSVRPPACRNRGAKMRAFSPVLSVPPSGETIRRRIQKKDQDINDAPILSIVVVGLELGALLREVRCFFLIFP